MEVLTSTQKTVFSYITKHLDKEGIPPTLNEIAVNFHYKSINSVRSHLKLIEKNIALHIYSVWYWSDLENDSEDDQWRVNPFIKSILMKYKVYLD